MAERVVQWLSVYRSTRPSDGPDSIWWRPVAMGFWPNPDDKIMLWMDERQEPGPARPLTEGPLWTIKNGWFDAAGGGHLTLTAMQVNPGEPGVPYGRMGWHTEQAGEPEARLEAAGWRRW